MPLPKDIHILIPETCEIVNLHGKRHFTDVIKLRILQLGGLSVFSSWVQGNHMGSHK